MEKGMPRRQFLRLAQQTALAGVLVANLRPAGAAFAASSSRRMAAADKPKSHDSGHKHKGDKAMPHTLPDLPYAFNALEPYIDEQTMKIHHDGHHAAYVKNLNTALEKHPDLASKSVEDLLVNIKTVPEDIRQAVINNGGGHLNHSMFWPLLAPANSGGGGEPSGEIADALKSTFGGYGNFREAFTKAATTRFGSGWAWLSLDRGGKLVVHSTANQDSPILEGSKPILCLDVWEHAYYLKYQNRRPEYIEAWWKVVNWKQANENFAKIRR